MCIWGIFRQQPCDGSKRGQKWPFTLSIGVVGCCVCPPRPPGFLYFPNSTGEMETHTPRQIWIKGWVSGSVMVHQSKSHSLRTIKESRRIGEYMNTKSVHPGAQLRRFVDKAVPCDNTTNRSSRPGVWNPLGWHAWRRSTLGDASIKEECN